VNILIAGFELIRVGEEAVAGWWDMFPGWWDTITGWWDMFAGWWDTNQGHQPGNNQGKKTRFNSFFLYQRTVLSVSRYQ